ncbi:ROK family protein [Paenibacillus sp. LPE1-1-1.1]|uniref:ROK family protein n=1 Tax=Paenibacillus sp. LPE1-1-1.1 TaxID=3135230 RepID=UPI0039C9E2C2
MVEKGNANLMKEINLNNLRRVLKQVGIATKPQLAAMTGLSVVTINSLVKELLDFGELLEDKSIPSNGGRPALTYRFNYDFSLALAIHLNEKQGSDVIFASVVNLREDILMREEHVIQVFDLHRFLEMIDRILALFPSIKSIGIGIPGQTINDKIAVTSHEELQGISLLAEVQSKFSLPVILENDVNAAVSGYCFKEQLSENQIVLGVYFPEKSPPGLGIFLDGKIVKGKNGMAGEIKFLPMDIDWKIRLSTEEFLEIVCKVMQTLHAVLAPDQIVIYRENLEESALLQAWESFIAKYNLPSLPEISVSDTFIKDFEEGMKWLALQELNPSALNF